jgi:hypothetical protein
MARSKEARKRKLAEDSETPETSSLSGKNGANGTNQHKKPRNSEANLLNETADGLHDVPFSITFAPKSKPFRKDATELDYTKSMYRIHPQGAWESLKGYDKFVG